MKACTRPTYAEISLAAVGHNIRKIKERVSPARVMAVVKADGYGHGAVATAKAALANGADSLAVALIDEAIQLRQAGLTAPVLVLGGFFDSDAEVFGAYELEATILDFRRARALSELGERDGKRIRVHLKVDTGMGRLGVDWLQARTLAGQLVELPGLQLAGLFTHLATADLADKSFARTQLGRFQDVIVELDRMQIAIPLKHAANSGAVLDLPESYFDLVRVGVSMYGYYPSRETSESLPLMPAMTLKSKIMATKKIAKGGYISYGLTYQAPGEMRIAIVPVGYGDGYNRKLSNNAEVLIHGRRCPVIGRVCMDQIMVGLSDDISAEVGDDVVLMGKQGDAEISIYEICDKLDTIPYEVTCWASKRVPRVYAN